MYPVHIGLVFHDSSGYTGLEFHEFSRCTGIGFHDSSYVGLKFHHSMTSVDVLD